MKELKLNSNLAIMGGGSCLYVAAIRGAQLGAKASDLADMIRQL